MYDAVPTFLCHNDLAPGNAIVYEDHVHLLDFEKAAPAPVGSDMHTILRWGGKSLVDDREAERLLVLYTREVQRVRPDITLDQVRVGAWVTFFMRYSAIAKWPSARNLESFSLAMLKGRKLLPPAT
jgi:thiamine kinase-like enzyme